MQSIEITIVNENGLHTRPGKNFVQACKKFESDGKSLMKLMAAGICKDDVIQIHATGADEQEAITYLSEFVAQLEG